MKFRKKIFLFVTLLYILYVVFPLFNDFFPVPSSIWSVGIIIVLFILYPRAFINPVVKWFLIYSVLLGIYTLLDKPLTIGIGTVTDSKKLFIEYGFLFPSVAIFSILNLLKDERIYRLISSFSVVFLALSFLYLIPLILSGNATLREAVGSEMYENIKIMGVPGYALMHAYVIALPGILFGVRKSKNRTKLLLIGFLALFIFVLFNTYITTAMTIMVTVIITVLLYNGNNKPKSFLLLSLVGFTVFIINSSGIIINFFDFLVSFFEGTAAQSKMEDFRMIYMTGGEIENAENITGRASLHDKSWVAFFEYPIFGNFPVGGHSSLLDRLGGMGLVVFIPFMMMIFTQIKAVLLLLKNSEQRFYYYLGIFSAFVMLYQKGLFGQEGWLFLMVLLPALVISFGTQVESKQLLKTSKKGAIVKVSNNQYKINQ